MPNDTTQRGYPLPHPDNVAREDATRIRNAIAQISDDMTALEDRNIVATESEVGGVRLATAAEAADGIATNAVPVVKRVKDMIAALAVTSIDALREVVTTLAERAMTSEADITTIKGTVAGHTAAISDVNTTAATKLAKSANLADVADKAAARNNIGAQVAGNYQTALGFNPVNKAGDTVAGALTVQGQLMGRDVYNNRGDGTGYYFFAGNAGIYFGWNGSGNIVSTHWLISPNGYRYIAYNEGLVSMRAVSAGTFMPAWNDWSQGQISHAFVTSVMTNDGGWTFYARYIQFAVNGQWVTAGWAS
ncbi:hypothetical protein [Bradyrhizobium sp. SZCCHNR1045]|uniref:hypothetical protein n=1 Tax=Bradyrhizobium sp. SZCCHNR1045 TaxID=3057353 RepID=UPI00291666C9|nr:hypothetical protein [Bradyrhizobium sp. SZCCHNR1045]